MKSDPQALHGVHAMLYAYFDADGRLDRDAMRRQVQCCIAHGARGLAVLGLATEVGKLADDERRMLIDWLVEDSAGRVPLGVTIAGATVAEQVALAEHAARRGADWLILQPPAVPGLGEAAIYDFFAEVLQAVRLPAAIQNAPEYLGVGLGLQNLLRLAGERPRFQALKGEAAATVIQPVVAALAGRLPVLNGRGGLELLDNLRAGCAGVIVAPDTFDRQVRIHAAFRDGALDDAEALYREVLPAIVFVMQSLDTLICYGKRIAAWRIGLGEVHDRMPALHPTPFGLATARRLAAALGTLAG